MRKYSNASLVKLQLRIEGGDVVLSIQDNGVGFDTGNRRVHGHGIAGMKHRTQMFNGSLALRSEPGKGTHIEVRMPVGFA